MCELKNRIMKPKLIIASWLISLSLFATSNIYLALIALCLFGVSSVLIAKHKKEVLGEADKFNKWIDKLINDL